MDEVFFFCIFITCNLHRKLSFAITRFLKWVYLGIKQTNEKNMTAKSDYRYRSFTKESINNKNISIKVDHEIFYLIKYIQQVHLISKRLSLSQKNHPHKEEV